MLSISSGQKLCSKELKAQWRPKTDEGVMIYLNLDSIF